MSPTDGRPGPGPSAPARALFLLTSSNIGGTEASVAQLVAALDPSRVRAFAATVSPPGPIAARFEAAGIAPDSLDAGSRWSYARAAARLRRIIVRDDVRVVYSFGLTAALLTRLATPGLAVARVFAHRGAIRERGATLRLKRRLSNGSDAAIYNSSAVRNQAVRSFGFRGDHAHVVPNGVVVPPAGQPDVAVARRMLHEMVEPLGPDSINLRIVLTIANLRPEKDYDTLLRAIRRVSDERPDVRLVAIGDGSRMHRERLVRLRNDLSLESRVAFVGFRNDTTQLLSGADLFVLSTHTESFPNSVLEAMAAGLPVIATDVGGVAESINSPTVGRVVPPGDADALATAILELLASPNVRTAMGDAARARVREQFSLSRAARRTEDILLAAAFRAHHTESPTPDDVVMAERGTC